MRPENHGHAKKNGRSKAGRQTLLKTQLAIKEVLPELPLKAIKPDAAVVDELGLDSLKAAQLSLALEQAFGRPIFVGELFAEVDDPRSLTVRELAKLIEHGR
jgi:acyl carrier protein